MKQRRIVHKFLAGIAICIVTFHCRKSITPIYPDRIIAIDPDIAREEAERIRAEVAVDIAKGLELSLWASDSLIKDPIAISADPFGGIYYSRASRLEHSEFDIRGHRDWMTSSISFQTVEDRRAFLRNTFAPEKSEESQALLEDLNGDSSHDWRDLTVEKEAIWRLEDSDGDGVADQSRLFLEDFHEEITDCANGVEFFENNVYVAVGPDLWRTQDRDGDGIADQKESLAHGFAVHIGFGAHGMSGVTVGPQGRIWWGIGDIGMNVVDRSGKRWQYPNQGVIVRCEPDGSNFEVFAAGLRNTHEFVFDKFGNLISEDNDGDHAGERERLVYITNGSDGGWRINWQFGKYTDPDNNAYKVWMDEKLHVPRWEGQAAYITPPIVNYVNGPTGMVYNPGTALGPDWNDYFFIAEFRGSAANSPIHAFTLEPDGASFKMSKTQEVVKGLLPTGLDFGPDGALYFADWIDGWGVKQQGRMWKLDVPSSSQSTLRDETAWHLRTKFRQKSNHELGELLAFDDMRVRQKAQFELVRRGQKGVNELKRAVNQRQELMARIHGIWGIAQAARHDTAHAKILAKYLDDSDAEIQAQAAKMIGDVRFTGSGEQLIAMLQHSSLRVQFFAAEALGRTKEVHAVEALIQMLIKNDDKDAWLRHAGCLALARIGNAAALMALKEHPSRAARIAAVVALRRMQNPGIAHFLQDVDEFIVTEAARGINDDFSIEPALPDLAKVLATTTFVNEPLIRRAINANLRVGNIENLEILHDYISDKASPPALRAEALSALSTWAKPSVLDRVDGRYRGEIKRDITPVLAVLGPQLNILLNEDTETILVAAMDAAARLGLKNTATTILRIVSQGRSPKLSLAGLHALERMQADELAVALERCIRNKHAEVRAEALALLPKSDIPDDKAAALFSNVLNRGTIVEKQAALAGLGAINSDAATDLIGAQLEKLLLGKIPPELHLDVIEVARDRDDKKLAEELAKLDASYADDPLGKYRPALAGGNAGNGRRIFYRHEAAQCVRCHSIWEWGGDAGPSLMGVGDRLTPEKLLEALILPSAELAPGYGVVSLELTDGKIVAGKVLEENPTHYILDLGKDQRKTIDKTTIAKEDKIPSAMPSVVDILSPGEIRDIVAFLSSLKQEI